ncbi:hypothetical protein JCGZ_23972 [Jatropha curcas]|uniref:Uncharacterized protein n=1 Tax=Jatropha curcas TaxID=180498 RepID=A0A067JZK4_JATCU|nr:hypothetical protein JCGZ_23972 [Jatropha curcas]
MFGEVGALCCRHPKLYISNKNTYSKFLRLKAGVLIESMQTKQEDYVARIKNFLQHHKKLKDLKIAEFLDEGGEEDYPNIAVNLLIVARPQYQNI